MLTGEEEGQRQEAVGPGSCSQQTSQPRVSLMSPGSRLREQLLASGG